MNARQIAAFVVLAVLTALIYVVYTTRECKVQNIQTEGLVR